MLIASKSSVSFISNLHVAFIIFWYFSDNVKRKIGKLALL